MMNWRRINLAIPLLVEELDAPVNILVRRGAPAPDVLARLGVARLSVGGGLYRVAQGAVADAIARLRAGEAP